MPSRGGGEALGLPTWFSGLSFLRQHQEPWFTLEQCASHVTYKIPQPKDGSLSCSLRDINRSGPLTILATDQKP